MLTVGVGIGGTKIAGGVADRCGRIRAIAWIVDGAHSIGVAGPAAGDVG